MSDLRIALVSEGPTDDVLLESALKAILGQQTFVLTLLRPEATNPDFGGGWGGVLKWCAATAKRWDGLLEDDPLLVNFDLLIIHLDADVAHQAYANCGPAVEAMASHNNWPVLPCNQPCPPVEQTCKALQSVLTGWLSPVVLGAKTVVCLPAQSTGAWLAVATLPSTHALLSNVECNQAVEDSLGSLTKQLKVKKSVLGYRAKADAIRQHWNQVKALCGQAAHFESAVQTVLR